MFFPFLKINYLQGQKWIDFNVVFLQNSMLLLHLNGDVFFVKNLSKKGLILITFFADLNQCYIGYPDLS